MEVIMNILRYSPFREMDDFFGRFRHGLDFDLPLENLTQSDWVPVADINESDDEYLVTVEIPQVDKNDIKVEVQNGMLNISGERKYENEDKKAHRIERFYGSFQRSFKLPENVLEDKIHADHKDGLLYVKLPKSEKALPKRKKIEIH
jgi:HSP20 family protein